MDTYAELRTLRQRVETLEAEGQRLELRILRLEKALASKKTRTPREASVRSQVEGHGDEEISQ